ncbi:hypothetical protein D3C72_771920 [compost metagenome]
MLDLWAQLVNRSVIDVVDAQHRMGIAHRHGGQLDLLPVHFQRVTQGLRRCIEGNLGRDQPWRPHVNADLPVVAYVQLNDAALGFDADTLFRGQAFVQHEAGKATRTVATLLNLGTVGVENPIAEIHVRVARCFDDQQLVETDAGVPVAPLLGMLGQDVRVLADQVEDHEVVAQPMHLGKTQQHGLTPAAGFRQHTVRRRSRGGVLRTPGRRRPGFQRNGHGCCSWSS